MPRRPPLQIKNSITLQNTVNRNNIIRYYHFIIHIALIEDVYFVT